MSEQEMQDLLDDLAGRGFNDELLSQDIELNEAYGLPRFSISRVKEFGEERMYYKLTFQWMESSLGYEFTAINARHRMHVDIGHNIVNGINSIELDQEMAKLNWSKYWESRLKGEHIGREFEMAPHCIDGLAQLLLSESLQAKFTGESLMYKHWPYDVFNNFTEEPARMRRLYEHDYSFDLKDHPNITAELAYLIISERIDALVMHISDLGASQIPESVVESESHSMLKGHPDKADLKFSFSSPVYFATLTVPVFLDKAWYNLEGYTLSLVELPEIKHGTFNGVDSERLDKKLSTINWREDKDIVFIKKNSEVWFPRDIELLQEELFRMAFYPEGKDAADKLMLKHWLCAPIFEDFISEQAKETLLSLPIKAARFSSDIEVDKAISLISGRPVWKELSADQQRGIWQRIVTPTDARLAELETFEAISRWQLGAFYDMIPFPERKKETILHQLLNGQEVVVQANNGQMFRLELTEKVDGIRIFDSKGREIPFNFQLTPDWKPDQRQAVDQWEDRSQSMTAPNKISVKNSNKKSKGRGL